MRARRKGLVCNLPQQFFLCCVFVTCGCWFVRVARNGVASFNAHNYVQDHRDQEKFPWKKETGCFWRLRTTVADILPPKAQHCKHGPGRVSCHATGGGGGEGRTILHMSMAEQLRLCCSKACGKIEFLLPFRGSKTTTLLTFTPHVCSDLRHQSLLCCFLWHATASC